jgi:hypothetical protein
MIFLHSLFMYRVHAIQRLPYIVGINPHMSQVYRMYLDSFRKLSAWPEIKSPKEEEGISQHWKGIAYLHLECKRMHMVKNSPKSSQNWYKNMPRSFPLLREAFTNAHGT